MKLNAQKEIDVTEIRHITHNGELVGNPEVRVIRPGGTYSSTVPLHLPANARRGAYQVRVTVESSYARDTRETYFTVE
jgi:hypothetical protein